MSGITRAEIKTFGIKAKLHIEAKAKPATANVYRRRRKILYRTLACMACPVETLAGAAVRARGPRCQGGCGARSNVLRPLSPSSGS